MKMRKGDIAIILVIFVAATTWFLWPKDISAGSFAQVWVNNDLVQTIDLSKDGFYDVQGIPGAGTLEVKDGRIRMQHMPRDICPDGICCRITGWIENTIQSIVCLPNKIVVSLTTPEDQDDYDFLTR